MRGRRQASLRAATIVAVALVAAVGARVGWTTILDVPVVQDSVAVADEVTITPPLVLTIDETVGASDTSSAQVPLVLPIAESAHVDDAVSVLPSLSVTIDESVQVHDEIETKVPVVLPVAEGVTVADAVSVQPAAQAPATEGVGVGDDVSIVLLDVATTTNVDAPVSVLAGTSPHVVVSVVAGVNAPSRGDVVLEENGVRVAGPTAVAQDGKASFDVAGLSLGDHQLVARYLGADGFKVSSGLVTIGVFDYAVHAVGPATATLRGAPTVFGVSVDTVPGSTTRGLPQSLPLSVAGFPSDAAATTSAVAFGNPGQFTVRSGAFSLGDFPLVVRVGERSTNATLRLYDYSLSLTPDQTVQRGSTAHFVARSFLLVGSTSTGLPETLPLVLNAVRLSLQGATTLGGETGFDVATLPDDQAGPSTATVIAQPGDRTATSQLYVNASPSAAANGPYKVDEGGASSLSGSVAGNADGDPVSMAWDLDADGTYETSGGSATFSAATIDGPATKTVAFRACDTHAACTVDTAQVAIINIAPRQLQITSPVAGNAVSVGALVQFNGSYVDPGIADTHSATWTVGTTTFGGKAANGIATGSRSFATAGVFTVKMTIADDDGGTATIQGGELIVTDQAGAAAGAGVFMRGGRPSIFAIAAGYRGTAVTGTTLFQLADAGITFRSTSYQWLAVSGGRAVAQGVGTVGGVAGYAFRWTAEGGAAGRIALRITRVPSGAVVYDLPSQALAIGQIVVTR